MTKRSTENWVLFENPIQWHSAYTEADTQGVIRILGWLNDNKRQQAWLARLSRVNRATLNLVLKGVYTCNPQKFIKQALESIETHETRSSIKTVPFVKTSVAQLAHACCQRARTYRSFAILSAYVGTGKTRSLKEIAANTENTFLIESDPGMCAVAMLTELVDACGVTIPGRRPTAHVKFRALINYLRGTNCLLIIDEAETLNNKALHYLRRIRDKAQVGIVLAGTEELHGLISPLHGEYDQIRSRVCFWPKTVRGVLREDAEAIIVSAFDDQEVMDTDEGAEVLECLWNHCGGSIRLLVEDLIPAIRDYGLRNHPLSTQLINKIASDVLSLPPARS